ncbi:MAG: hypothetical protein ABJA79_08295 [Parafilimonas sp.]
MKFLITCILLILFPSLCFSQKTRYNKKDSLKIGDVDYMQFNLECNEKNKLSGAVPFNKISVIDVRFDTSFIAIYWKPDPLSVIRNKKLDLKNGFAVSLTNYLNKFYENNFSNNNSEIICYLKRFSIAGKDTILENISDENIVQAKFEAECYYKTNNLLYPAVRIDTIFAERVTKIKNGFVPLIKEIIIPLTEKLNQIDSLRLIKRKTYTVEEIEERYKSRFNLPILTADKYVKGVYMSFQEFKNNAPSIKQFTIKKEKANTFYLRDSLGSIISPLKKFGFCDGTTCWIQSGDFCFPIFKIGNSFEYFYTLYYNNSYFVQTVKLLFGLNMDLENSK